MKPPSHTRTSMHPYHELIAVVQESTSDLVEHRIVRDRERFAFERHKLVLLVVLILSLWTMFFLLWKKLDDLQSASGAPSGQYHPSPFPPPPLPNQKEREPSPIHYVL